MPLKLFDGNRAVGVLFGLLVALLPVNSLAQGQQKGDASLRVEYQYIGTGNYQGNGVVANFWTTEYSTWALGWTTS